MKITAQEEYGLRCLLQLAKAPRDQLMSVKEIAEKEGLSSAYVEKLLRLLAKSGLVHSMRGLRGGYILNRPSASITLGEVMRALGTMPNTDQICHQFTGKEAQCVHFTNCGIRSVWSGLTTYMQNFMDHTIISSLLDNEFEVSARMSKRFNTTRER